MQFVRPLVGASMAGVLLLSGCSLLGGDANPSASATPKPSKTAVESVGEKFTEPADCTTILPQSQVDSYAAEKIVLLAGPGGIYGDQLVPDPTPETLSGGISCYFGYDSDVPDGIEIYSVISVVPVDSTTRGDIVQSLIDQGLNEGENAAGESTYAIIGDSDANIPAILNVVNDTSWISVISVFGGQTFFEENVVISELVHDQVYN